MDRKLISSFAVRLRDVLATLESTAVLGASETRMRGIGEQLQFACMALPCDEALVAIEHETLGRLNVSGVASSTEWRSVDHEFLPSGTPFAFLLGGGGGYAAELAPDDPMLAALEGVLETTPQHAIFVPLRVGTSVVGGAALLREGATMGDRELEMAERLAEVLALTLEAFRTERVLLQVFARVLPDLCAHDSPTAFVEGLEKYVHNLRLAPEYRLRLSLADSTGRIAAKGRAEASMVADILGRVERYVNELQTGGQGDDDEEIAHFDADDLIG